MERVDTTNPKRHWRFSAKNYDTLMPPGPLAEYLEPEIVLAGMRHCMTLRKAEGQFHSAWHHIEFAMNQNVDYLDDSLRRKYIGDAAYLLGNIIESFNQSTPRRANPTLYAQVLTLNTFLPVLTKRALQHEITSTDCLDVYSSLGYIFRDINSLSYPDSSFKGARFAEIIGPALGARTRRPDVMLYPASPREEASTWQPLNHDGYFVKSGQKIPIQTKLVPTEKTYDNPTRTIYIEPLARHALIRADMLPTDVQLPIGTCSEMIAELISEEAEGTSDSQAKAALDYLTRSVVARFEYEQANAA